MNLIHFFQYFRLLALRDENVNRTQYRVEVEGVQRLRLSSTRNVSIGYYSLFLYLSRLEPVFRQAVEFPLINGPSFARDISRCSVVTCALLAFTE